MLSQEEIKFALALADGNLHKAAETLGIKYQILYWNVKKFNIKYTSEKPIINSNKANKLYQKHHSLEFVAKELGCTKEGIRLVLKRIGADIDAPIRYSFNERFFLEDTEFSFYWAGFIAADGCIKNKKKCCELDIGLSIKDKSHIELFKNHINATHPINEYLIKNNKKNPKWNDSWKAEIKLRSKHLQDDLSRFNIVQRKTHVYTFPEWLLSHPLLNHFMRGYFDGDGSWFIGVSKKTPQLCFSLRGTQKFLEIYRSVLEEKCGLPPRYKDIRVNNGIGILEYGGNGVISKIRDFLYADAETFMQRKFDKVKDVVTVPRLSVTPEMLIQKMQEFGDQKKIAEYFGCSRPNISRYIEKFGIRNEISKAKAACVENI